MVGKLFDGEFVGISRNQQLRIMQQDFNELQSGIKIEQSKRVESRKSRVIILSIPSESFPTDLAYTIAIEFKTEDDSVDENTPVQVFLNVPSFQFQLTYVYNKHNYIIPNFEKLYNPKALKQAPLQTNPTQQVGTNKYLVYAIFFIQKRFGKDLSKDVNPNKKLRIPTTDEVTVAYNSLKKQKKPNKQKKAFKY